MRRDSREAVALSLSRAPVNIQLNLVSSGCDRIGNNRHTEDLGDGEAITATVETDWRGEKTFTFHILFNGVYPSYIPSCSVSNFAQSIKTSVNCLLVLQVNHFKIGLVLSPILRSL